MAHIGVPKERGMKNAADASFRDFGSGDVPGYTGLTGPAFFEGNANVFSRPGRPPRINSSQNQWVGVKPPTFWCSPRVHIDRHRLLRRGVRWDRIAHLVVTPDRAVGNAIRAAGCTVDVLVVNADAAASAPRVSAPGVVALDGPLTKRSLRVALALLRQYGMDADRAA